MVEEQKKEDAEMPPSKEELDDKKTHENFDAKAEAENGKNSIEEAKDVLKQICEQNKILAENLKRAEQINAEILISGRGRAVPAQTKDDKEIDEARALLKDTGYDELLFPRK